MKKTSKTTTKAPAPASKSKRSKSSTPTAKIASLVSASSAPVSTAADVSALAAVPVPGPVTTKIRATVDVGFGNALFVRGEGAGLNWSKGLALQCVSADEWLLELPESSGPIVFKFLLNDKEWCVGDDYRIAAGGESTFAPVF